MNKKVKSVKNRMVFCLKRNTCNLPTVTVMRFNSSFFKLMESTLNQMEKRNIPLCVSVS